MPRSPALAALPLGLFLVSCSSGTTGIAGNSTSTGNAQATGTVVRPDGAPARGAWIECRPNSLISWEPLEEAWTVRTDSTGRFLCDELPEGGVGVSALDPASGLSRWHHAQASRWSLDTAHRDTLAPSGALRVALPPQTHGTLHLSGLGRYLPVNGESVVTFRDLPGGWSGAVRLTTVESPSRLLDSGSVRSGKVDSAGFTRIATVLNLPLAGKLSSTLRQVPLLVRLDSTWTGFVHSLPDGSDLRLSLPDGTPLPLTVAAWDKSTRTGALWTFLDSLAAPADSIRLVLGSGLPVPATSVATGFSAANGWVAAWSLGDSGTGIAERTDRFTGTTAPLPSVPGAIGMASRFDGRTTKVLVPVSAGSALDLPEGGPFTLSCWARLTDFGTSRFLLGRGEYGYGLKFQRNLGTDTGLWLGIDGRSSGAPSSYFATAPADTGVWRHLTMTVADSLVALYVDGIRQDTGTRSFSNAQYRHPTAFAIGAILDTTGTSSQHFAGDLSEVWLQSTARSPDWIRLTAANQKPEAPIAKVR